MQYACNRYVSWSIVFFLFFFFYGLVRIQIVNDEWCFVRSATFLLVFFSICMQVCFVGILFHVHTQLSPMIRKKQIETKTNGIKLAMKSMRKVIFKRCFSFKLLAILHHLSNARLSFGAILRNIKKTSKIQNQQTQVNQFVVFCSRLFKFFLLWGVLPPCKIAGQKPWKCFSLW